MDCGDRKRVGSLSGRKVERMGVEMLLAEEGMMKGW